MSVLVESANKGGLLVKYGIYDGFVPVSQFGSVSTAAFLVGDANQLPSRAGLATEASQQQCA